MRHQHARRRLDEVVRTEELRQKLILHIIHLSTAGVQCWNKSKGFPYEMTAAKNM